MVNKKQLLKSKRSNSRQHFNHSAQLLKCKRSQMTIFVILAIAIVSIIVILFLPNIKQVFVSSTPDVQIQECLRESVQEELEKTLPNAGSKESILYYTDQNINYEYLCYTDQWYDKCTMQKPLLKQGIEAEIEASVQESVKACINNLKSTLRNKGYDVESTGSNYVDVKIVPGSIIVSIDSEFSLKREEEVIELKVPSTDFSSEAYKLIMVAYSILSWETKYGDADTMTYMGYYPDLKVEKYKQSDGTTLYTITNRDTEENIRFASRSIAWPPGYALPPQ